MLSRKATLLLGILLAPYIVYGGACEKTAALEAAFGRALKAERREASRVSGVAADLRDELATSLATRNGIEKILPELAQLERVIGEEQITDSCLRKWLKGKLRRYGGLYAIAE